ncbi:hypothetical protein T265_00840 [Opisthorchis viverrini]|uniref:NADH dehydrogenase [ubiquinone] 1 beta subcomplex subunit 5, mitochondrial n=1 Tax=Opisthorchis viverrini TaxID=6198 RepID=A0A075A4E3_OPIVI|nr:hypothetical protein T265_00840 [Opisthorchis viverrini]KER33137.1 hypothetical protein T265_00840 [Opisthorchis viverrini]
MMKCYFETEHARWPKWLEREFTDRKVLGSNPTSASRLPPSRLGQPGTIPALVQPSGGMARYGVRTTNRVKQSIGYVGSSVWKCSTVVRPTSAIDLSLVTPYPTKNRRKVCFSIYNIFHFRNAGTKRLFEVKPSDFLNARALDTLHFYTMLGLVPCLVLVFLVNVFVGPAELTDIPEGYEPRYWEYHKHPISRFMAKYMSPHPQKVYESFLGQLEDIREQKELIFEDRWLRSSDRAHGDYRGWYFIPANPAGVNRARKELELDQEMGELDRWLRSSDRAHGDYRGWYFIPANPAGVNRARKELELDQEMGELWLEFTDRKVRGSSPTSASRFHLSRLGQSGNMPAPVLPSADMAVRHRKGATAERLLLYLLIRQSVVSAADPLQCLVSERRDSQKGTQQLYSEQASVRAKVTTAPRYLKGTF